MRPRPCSATRARKAGSIWDAQLAFPGIGTILPVMLDEGYHRRGVSLARTVELCCESPARIFGLESKGALLPGRDADFVVLDLELEREVSAEMLDNAATSSP